MENAATLEALEREYWDTPTFARPADLRAINRIRAELGMPEVDARLRPVGADRPTAEPKPAPDHSRARAMYRDYLTKRPLLDACRAHAEAVARTTNAPGMTPVEPLATMGPGGGPLVCDVCGKPMILEGGSCHGVYADEAWRRCGRPAGWRSYIKGGMVVRIAANGTLRIYHGYYGNPTHCCDKAPPDDGEGRPDPADFRAVLAMFEADFAELTDRDRTAAANDVVNTLADWDAGLGMNRPRGV